MFLLMLTDLDMLDTHQQDGNVQTFHTQHMETQSTSQESHLIMVQHTQLRELSQQTTIRFTLKLALEKQSMQTETLC